MPDGNRFNVFYIHPNRGKKLVTGPATKEKLGYIGYGSYIEGVHESDVAKMGNLFACGICQKSFSISGDSAWCNTCYPKQTPTKPKLGELKPRTYDQRLQATERFAQEQWAQPHKNFRPQNQLGQDAPPAPSPVPSAQQQMAPPPAQFNPNAGFSNQQVAPPPGMVMDDPKKVVGQARGDKQQAFGIPVVEPTIIGPPPNLSVQQNFTGKTELDVILVDANTKIETEPSRGVKEARISELDFGRSVNKKHKKVLAENGIVTLYDAGKLGVGGLEKIKGIGAGVAQAIMTEVWKPIE